MPKNVLAGQSLRPLRAAATSLIRSRFGSLHARRLLPEGVLFPFDFGFLPSTLGEDGDRIDILVLMDAPAHVGCLIQVRLIGITEAEQSEDSTTESNDRLLGVSVHSYDHENLHTIKDVSKTLLDQLEESFISYKKQCSKKFKVTGTGGPRKALEFLRSAIQARKEAKTK